MRAVSIDHGHLRRELVRHAGPVQTFDTVPSTRSAISGPLAGRAPMEGNCPHSSVCAGLGDAGSARVAWNMGLGRPSRAGRRWSDQWLRVTLVNRRTRGVIRVAGREDMGDSPRGTTIGVRVCRR